MNDRALKVLEQYELEVTAARRGRGSYILDTPDGIRILSDCAYSEHKALFQNRVMEQICAGGYERVDQILKNKEGNLISKDWEANQYGVRKWYTGRECDTENEQEILAAVENLARLHKVMHLKNVDEFERSFTAQPPLHTMRAQNTELKKVRSFIRRKNAKGDFEQQFLKDFPFYFEQAWEAQSKMEQKFGEKGIKESSQRGSVCHGDYDHHHVLITGYDMATTDFACCRFDFQVIDLYRFMRKILEKQEWNQRLGMRMLEHYIKIRPLAGEERELLYLRMLYPEKFRKLANYYYGGNKAWISRRFYDKLSMLNRQREKKEQFVRLLEW